MTTSTKSLKGRVVLFCTLAFLISSSSIFADYYEKPFNDQVIAINGWGSKTCGDFTSCETPRKMGITDWLGGFLTGVNSTQVGADRTVGSDLSFDTLEALLDQYCRDHPLDLIFKASTEIYAQLHKQQFGQ